jgi:hypothetical protein
MSHCRRKRSRGAPSPIGSRAFAPGARLLPHLGVSIRVAHSNPTPVLRAVGDWLQKLWTGAVNTTARQIKPQCLR